MKYKTILIYCLHLLGTLGLFSQEIKKLPKELLNDIYAQVAEINETENFDNSEIIEELLYFYQYPINLNNTNKAELEKLPFLTNQQIENLQYYLYKNFPMESIFELRLIDGFYKQDIRMLLPFVYVGKAEKKVEKLKWRNLKKYGKQELLTRVDKYLETKEGYKTGDKYLGNPYYYSLKYRYRYKKRIQFGFTAEKDAGEEFWGDNNKGFDFYSAYLQLNKLWKFKTIVVGNFNACYGEGLILNTNYSLGKSTMTTNINKRNSGLNKNGSSNEFHYLRGIGSVIKLNKLELSAFYSNKMIDGDTVNGTFRSFKTDGLHRTAIDLSKKRTVNMQTLGTHITYLSSYYHIGATITHTLLNHALMPTKQPYNRYAFSGLKQSAASIDYKLRWRSLFLFGETASTHESIATINGLSIQATSNVDLLLLHRYYPKNYNLILSNAFGENSQNNNEEGFYIGFSTQPFQNWKFSAYADSYHFPWLKFGVDKPSSGYDILFQTDYSPGDGIRMNWRFKYKEKEGNISTDHLTTSEVANHNKSSLRYQLQYKISDYIRLKNAIESNCSQKGTFTKTWGYLFSQDISFSFSKIPLSIDIRYAFFDTDNYDNRIYSYENDVLYAFSIPALYGKGNRCYINLKYQPLKNITIYFKIARTSYVNKESIGSGFEKIEGNCKTDCKLLLKWSW